MISKPLLECRGRAVDVNFRVVAVFFGDTCLVNDAFYKAFIFKGAKVEISAVTHLFAWCWWHWFLS